MTLPNGEQTLEVRDPKGTILGFIVPEKYLRDLLREREALQQVFAAEFPDYVALSNPRSLSAKSRSRYACAWSSSHSANCS